MTASAPWRAASQTQRQCALACAENGVPHRAVQRRRNKRQLPAHDAAQNQLLSSQDASSTSRLYSCERGTLHLDVWRESDAVPSESSSRTSAFGDGPLRLPTQGESVVRGIEPTGLQLQERERPPADVDFLSELIAIQQNGPKNLGFFGTRNMGFLHQNLIEVLSYAMVLTGNHIFTSGATGTNAAVIRGALRAEDPELLTVVLPQSLQRQPPESQDLLAQVKAENLIEMPQNDELSLMAASRICNRDILDRVQQVICFAFHDSNLLLETCGEAKNLRKIVTLFYLD